MIVESHHRDLENRNIQCGMFWFLSSRTRLNLTHVPGGSAVGTQSVSTSARIMQRTVVLMPSA
jgi:hypothetical protein